MHTMRAVVAESPDLPLRLLRVERPSPAAGQVLVRIKAAAVNPLDTKIYASKAAHAQQPLPAILGIDFAGIVEETGDGVEEFRPGDEVYGMAGGVGGLPGTLAEFGCFDARLLAPKPANLDFRQAAAMPLSAITAWEGLVDRARVAAGETVLVHAGAGGVGHMVVQLAAAFQARVYATVSPEKAAIVAAMGATPIDYTAVSPETYVADHTQGEGFDVVYDTLGGKTLDASFTSVKRYTGRVVSCLGWGTHALAPLSFRAASYSGVFTLMPLLQGIGREHHGKILRKVCALAESGRVMPLVNQQHFTLETVNDAFAYVAAGKSAGKIVVEI